MRLVLPTPFMPLESATAGCVPLACNDRTLIGQTYFLLRLAPLFLVLGLTACGGGGGGSRAPEPTGPTAPSSQVFAGINRSYNEAVVQVLKSEQEYKNLSQYGTTSFSAGTTPSSQVHPLELTNVHKAYGYGLSGAGESIAIFDAGFNTDEAFRAGSAFAEMQTKYAAGRISIPGNLLSSTSSHGNQVASIAAAGRDSQGYNYYLNATGQRYPGFVGNAFDLLNHGMMGVAYNASLILNDVDSLNTLPLLAEAVDAAAQQGAVVQNNSWGLSAQTGRPFNRARVLTLPGSLPEAVVAGDRNAAYNWLADYTGFTASNWQDYLGALERFQNTGVVVTALQNDFFAREPSLMAALPQVVPDLKPAWIAVGNIDSAGSGPSIARISAPCGATAPYCLVVDGTEVTGAGLNNAGGASPGYSYGQTGTSFAAPQISGMVALLAEAFPSLTPKDLVTRLLATANNSFFTPTGERSFSAEISHGYNEEFGHGIPDLYAALQPITSGARPLGFVLNGSPIEGRFTPVVGSGLMAGPSLTRALQAALYNQTAYSYDALGAGFQVSLGALVQPGRSVDVLGQWLRQPLAVGRSGHTKGEPGGPWGQSSVSGKGTFYTSGLGETPYSLSLSSGLSLADFSLRSQGSQGTTSSTSPEGPLPTASLFSSFAAFGIKDFGAGLALSDLQIATSLQLGEHSQVMSYLSQSRTSRTSRSADNRPNVFGTALGLTLTDGTRQHGQLLFGIQREAQSLRGSLGEGALALGEHTDTIYLAPVWQFETGKGWQIAAGGSLGLSRTKAATGSLVQGAGGVLSSEFFLSAERRHWLKDHDAVSLTLWQPETIESGNLRIRLPQLVSPTAAVTHQDLKVNLASKTRPLVLGLGYQQQLSRATTLRQEVFLLSSGLAGKEKQSDLGFAIRLQQTW